MHKKVNIKKFFCIGFLFFGGAAFQACAVESAEIVFSMSVPRPSCSVSVESSKNLGELKLGKQKHPKIPVTIACSGTVKTALTAEPVDRTRLQADNETLSVPINDEGGPLLRLADNQDSVIKLTGKKNDAFCTSTGEGQTCYVAPVTYVKKNTPVGKGSVAIRFNVVYP
ncbi:hypothetical protein [Escherichia coli]|uniref:hypothetical protein n=1 Tax=Escherichia coli TaxID=562 RepID=UPI000BE1CB82|nr:hypothetical protein [Escherichia coli]CAD5742844.1 Uncharacterised protein [Escherichia coli]